MISQRFTSIITSFPNSKPEWLFKISAKAGLKNPPFNASTGGADTVTISTADLTVDLLSLCAGDVNKSYVPTGLAKSAAVSVNKTGVKKISSRNIFEVL